jgi:hypothetical protein
MIPRFAHFLTEKLAWRKSCSFLVKLTTGCLLVPITQCQNVANEYLREMQNFSNNERNLNEALVKDDIFKHNIAIKKIF